MRSANPGSSIGGVRAVARPAAVYPEEIRRCVMTARFSVGDHVTWNSEAGHVSGTITKIHTSDFTYKGHPRRASEDNPQYEIKSDRTDHVAAHKGSALTLSDPPGKD